MLALKALSALNIPHFQPTAANNLQFAHPVEDRTWWIKKIIFLQNLVISVKGQDEVVTNPQYLRNGCIVKFVF